MRTSVALRPAPHGGVLSLEDMFEQFDGLSLTAPNLLPGEVVNYSYGAGWSQSDLSVITTPTTVGDMVQVDSKDSAHDESGTATLQVESILKKSTTTDSQSDSSQINLPAWDCSWGDSRYDVVTTTYTLFESFDSKGTPDYVSRSVEVEHSSGISSWFQFGSLFSHSSEYRHSGFEQTNVAWIGGALEEDRTYASTSQWSGISLPGFSMGSGSYVSSERIHTQLANFDEAGQQISIFEEYRLNQDRGSSSQLQLGDFSMDSWLNHHEEESVMRSIWDTGAFVQNRHLSMDSSGGGTRGVNFEFNWNQFSGHEQTRTESVNHDLDGLLEGMTVDVVDHYFGGRDDLFNFKTLAGDFSGQTSSRFDLMIENIDTVSVGGEAAHLTRVSYMASTETTFSAPGMDVSHHEESYSLMSTVVTTLGQSALGHDLWM